MEEQIDERWACFVQIDEEDMCIQVNRDEVPDYLEKGNLMWIDILDPTAEDTGWLEEVFDFHTLALSDVLNNDVHPKQETYDDILFTVFAGVNFSPNEYVFDTVNLNLFLSKQYLVTAHCHPLKTVNTVKTMVKTRERVLSRGADHVYYCLLDGLVDRYVTVIDKMEDDIEDLEEAVFEGLEENIQETLFELKRHAAHAKRSLRPKKEALRVLVNKELPQITDETRTHLRDVLDHVSGSINHLEAHRELLNSLMDSYMSRISNKMSRVMEMLTIIATIMLPLSVITGVFGMNFRYIPGLDSHIGFWVLMLFMGALATGMILVFRKKGIL